MRITSVSADGIRFDNGHGLSDYHSQQCCENNYADWKQLEELAYDTNFDEPLTLESVDDYGFRFGNPPLKMFFVPCYSEQNGYYSYDIEIEYWDENGKVISRLETICA